MGHCIILELPALIRSALKLKKEIAIFSVCMNLHTYNYIHTDTLFKHTSIVIHILLYIVKSYYFIKICFLFFLLFVFQL